MPDERIEKISLADFGLLDTSQFPDDVTPKRARECYDLIMSERGRVRSLSKRPGYEFVADNIAEYVDSPVENEKWAEGTPAGYTYSTRIPYQRRSTIFKNSSIALSAYIFTSVDASGLDYSEVRFSYTADGITWETGFTINGYTQSRFTVDAPYIDFELDTDGTNVYIAYFVYNVDLSTNDIFILSIPWSEFTGSAGNITNLTVIDSIGTTDTTAIEFNTITCKYVDGVGLLCAYLDNDGTDVDLIFNLYVSGSLSRTETFSTGGSDYSNPVLRYDYSEETINVVYFLDGSLNISYTTDLVSWTTEVIHASDYDESYGISYDILPSGVTSNSISSHYLLCRDDSNALVLLTYSIGSSPKEVEITSSNTVRNYDLCLLYQTTPKKKWWALVYYDKTTSATRYDYIYSKLITNNDSSFRSERTVITYDAGLGKTTQIFGVSSNAYTTHSGTTFTSPNWQVTVTDVKDEKTPTIFEYFDIALDFKRITIEALTQDWFEEDGTLQMTCQASDEILYKWQFTTTVSAYWELLENTLTNIYASGGGRFRNDGGVIRMANDKLSTTKPVWYGYIKREIFQDGATDTPITSFDKRYVDGGHIAEPTGLNSTGTSGELFLGFGVAWNDSTASTDLVIPQGTYEYKFFYQYDGFQYSRMTDETWVKNIGDGDELGIRVAINVWAGNSGVLENDRISGIGIARKFIPADGSTPSDWGVLGFADITKGDRSTYISGEVVYTSLTTSLDFTVGTPARVSTGPTSFLTYGVIKLTDITDASESYHTITGPLATDPFVVVIDNVTGLTGGSTYAYEIYGGWHSVTTIETHAIWDDGLATLQTYTDLAGISENLESVDAHYRDRCEVNSRAFFAGVLYDPSGDDEELFDDTVFYGPLTGDGFFTKDIVDPSKYLTFGRGDGDNVVRIVTHSIGSDSAGTSSTELLAVFKRTSVFIIDVSGSPQNWKVVRKYEGVGLVGRDAILQLQGSIYFMDKQGLMQINGLELGEAKGWRRLDGYTKDFTDTQVRNAIIGYVGTRDWVIVMYPTRSSYTMFCYDRQFDEWGEFRFTDTPTIVTMGHGDSATINGTSGLDINQRMLFSDGSTVWAYPAFDLTTDDGTSFAGRWLADGKGAETPLTQYIVHSAGAAHYTEGADGTVSVLDEDGDSILSMTLTASTPGNVPSLATERVLNERTDAIGLQFDAAASATRSDLDSIEIEIERVRKIL